jgi:hypothetical protein
MHVDMHVRMYALTGVYVWGGEHVLLLDLHLTIYITVISTPLVTPQKVPMGCIWEENRKTLNKRLIFLFLQEVIETNSVLCTHNSLLHGF